MNEFRRTISRMYSVVKQEISIDMQDFVKRYSSEAFLVEKRIQKLSAAVRYSTTYSIPQ